MELNWVEIALQDPLIRPPVKKFGSFAGEIKRCLYAYLTSHHPRMEKSNSEIRCRPLLKRGQFSDVHAKPLV